MPALGTRLADLTVMAPGADPLTGSLASEFLPLMPASLANITIDTGLLEVPASRIKTVAIVVTTGLTWVTSGQPTVQLFAARSRYGTLGNTSAATSWGAAGGVNQPQTPFAGSSAAGSGFPTGNTPNSCTLVGAAVNLGPAAATALAANVYWFTATSPGSPTATPPTSMTELAQWYPVIGLEVKFPSALTAGSFFVAVEVAPL